MSGCRCTPTLKCCSEGVANSSLPQWEEVIRLRNRADEITEAAMKLPISDRSGLIMQAIGLRNRADRLERQYKD